MNGTVGFVTTLEWAVSCVIKIFGSCKTALEESTYLHYIIFHGNSQVLRQTQVAQCLIRAPGQSQHGGMCISINISWCVLCMKLTK